MIRCQSCARAGLLGNPSDGYGGKTISFTIGQYRATVELSPGKHLEFLPAPQDVDRFDSLDQFSTIVRQRGFYGGVRLLKATVKRFHDFSSGKFELRRENFSLTYQTNIPRGVGMAGSSAIITATLKALVKFYEVRIEPGILASLALSVERDVLGIPAGLQDRVIQMLEQVVYMDFSPAATSIHDGMHVGRYERLPVNSSIPLYVAYDTSTSEPTEVLHNDLARRYRDGESEVVDAMAGFAELARNGREAWLASDVGLLHSLIDQNFDLRKQICRLPQKHLRMINVARSTGASAKFCGSGGAIVGTFANDEHFRLLSEALSAIGCQTIQPHIV